MSILGLIIFLVGSLILILPTVVEITFYNQKMSGRSYDQKLEEKMRKKNLVLGIKVIFSILSLIAMIKIQDVFQVKSFYILYAWAYTLICAVIVIITNGLEGKYNITYKTAFWVLYITIALFFLLFIASIIVIICNCFI